MKLQTLGANKTVLSLDSGVEVFFSYNTPVAAFISGRGYIKTDKSWSATTARIRAMMIRTTHINTLQSLHWIS